MPAAAIHMSVASKLFSSISNEKDRFLIGSIAPDCWRNCGQLNRKESHFQLNSENEDYDLFYQKYKLFINDDFVLGYLIHLITDSYWRENVSCKYLEYEGNSVTLNKLDGTSIVIDDFDNNEYFNNQIDLLVSWCVKKYNLEDLFLIDVNSFNMIVNEINNEGLYKSIIYVNNKNKSMYDTQNELFDFDFIYKSIDDCCRFVLDELERLRSKYIF